MAGCADHDDGYVASSKRFKELEDKAGVDTLVHPHAEYDDTFKRSKFWLRESRAILIHSSSAKTWFIALPIFILSAGKLNCVGKRRLAYSPHRCSNNLNSHAKP